MTRRTPASYIKKRLCLTRSPLAFPSMMYVSVTPLISWRVSARRTCHGYGKKAVAVKSLTNEKGTEMAQRNQTHSQGETAQPGETWIPEHAIVLVIEPHAVWRIFLQAILSSYRYRVITAASSQEAEAAKQEIDPDDLGLVIADIHLHDSFQAQGGIKLFKRWTLTAPTLPFLLISDNPNDANLPIFRTRKASFLTKPVIRREALEVAAVRLVNSYPADRSI